MVTSTLRADREGVASLIVRRLTIWASGLLVGGRHHPRDDDADGDQAEHATAEQPDQQRRP